MPLNHSIELGCYKEASELGALPKVSVMPDLSCHRQAIISALRPQQGCKDPALLLPPLQPLFSHRTCHSSTGSSRCWLEGSGKAAPGMLAVLRSIHPRLWMGLSALLLLIRD